MSIECIIIDDEPLAVEKLEGFTSKVPGLNLVRTFDNALEAACWLRENKTDLIFLDIQMELFSGIQFLETVNPEARIIITSAYDQYAIKGFELNVTDYLLKPFSFQRFVKSVDKVLEYYSEKCNRIDNEQENRQYIFVKTEYRLERIDIGDIIYIEGMKDYLRIVCKNKKIMTLQSFSKLEASLPANRFCRVHKSYIVALDKIDSIERGVIKTAGERIPLTSTYRDNFFDRIKQKLT
jgi:two-component system, LytTR family, response regulator